MNSLDLLEDLLYNPDRAEEDERLNESRRQREEENRRYNEGRDGDDRGWYDD